MASRVSLACAAFMLLVFAFANNTALPTGGLTGPNQSIKTWCMINPQALLGSRNPDLVLMNNIYWVCAQPRTADYCRWISPGGRCYRPNLAYRASVLMNKFYATHGRTPNFCDFNHTGMVVTYNLGTALTASRGGFHGVCIYISNK